jgi:hypothetical protein
LIHAILLGIASHPRIQKPGIEYPVASFGDNNEVLIEQFRAYGGYELENPGLCCSVYPSYSSRETKGSSPVSSRKRSIEFQDYTLGNKFEEGSLGLATYNIIVELTYQDLAFGPSYVINYDSISPLSTEHELETPHGYNLQIQTELNPAPPTGEETRPEGVQQNLASEVSILINPAEELLREYMDLMRIVLDDLPSIKPYAIRSTKVLSVDFPTSAWSRKNEDIYFHSAYLSWELTLYSPSNWRQVSFMPTRNISNTLEVLP